ncbi:MAG: serine hydrolase domain-containing protein [Pseudomonadota bacterium]
MIRALLTLVALTLATATQAQLRSDLEQILADSTIPSMAYALIEDGEISEIDVLGDAPRDALYRAGSISKSVTSAMILSLVEDGVLDLDASFADAIPDADLTNDHPSPIRLVDLIEQTSGLPGTSYADYADQPTDLPALDVALSRKLTTRWEPGKFFSYANVNHTLAAAMAEAATGETIDTLVANRVFEPLGMTDATFDRATTKDRLVPSVDTSGAPLDYWDLEVRPSGALIGTIDDLAAFTRFIATDTTIVPRMRSPKAALVAQQGFPFIYGAGLFAFIENESVYYGHWGRIDGFQAVMGTNPETRSGFVLLANGADRQAFGAARARIAQTIDGAPAAVQPLDPAFEGDIEGWWLPFTEDNVKRAWISELLGLVHVQTDGGGLRLTPGVTPWASQNVSRLDASSFALPGFPVATHVFASDARGTPFMLGHGQASFRKISPAAAYARVVGLAAFFVTLIVSMVMGLVALMRRRAASPIWLAIGTASIFALSLHYLHVQWGMLSSHYAALAVPGTRSVMLLMLSVAWPLFALIAVYLIFQRWSDLGWMTRGSALFAVTSHATAVAFLTTFGFIPLVTWV